jgi:hypothetical protein
MVNGELTELQRQPVMFRNKYSTFIEVSKFYFIIITFITLYYIILFFFYMALQPNRGLWPPHSRGFRDHTYDAPQSVGLLWMGDQFVVETST